MIVRLNRGSLNIRALFLLLHIQAAACLSYGAAVVDALVSAQDGKLRFAVRASGVANVKSAVIICSYDSSKLSISGMTASSPLKAAGLGATIDRQEQRLSLTLTMASPADLTSTTEIAALKAPFSGTGQVTAPLGILSASFVDRDGRIITAQIGQVQKIAGRVKPANRARSSGMQVPFFLDGRTALGAFCRGARVRCGTSGTVAVIVDRR